MESDSKGRRGSLSASINENSDAFETVFGLPFVARLIRKPGALASWDFEKPSKPALGSRLSMPEVRPLAFWRGCQKCVTRNQRIKIQFAAFVRASSCPVP